jgi:nucleotide-binding universal stress UspA family protein
MFSKILNANDGSENAFRAFQMACDLAAAHGSELHMILVEEVPLMPAVDMIDEIRQAKASEDRVVRAEVKRAQIMARRRNVSVKCHVFTGHVVRTVVDFANDNRFDLLVIGATGHAAFYERMLGTRADRIAHAARCAVLIVR